MKRRDLTLLSFKKVSYKAWIKLALIWKLSQNSLMLLELNLTTAGMLRPCLTSWWLAECWVSKVDIQIDCYTIVKPTLTIYCSSTPAAPGGTLSDDMTRTEFCLFTAQEDLETMQAYAQVRNAKHSPLNGILTFSLTCPWYISLGVNILLLDWAESRHFLMCLQVFNKLIRRYKYLEKGFEEEIKKVSGID